MEIVFDRAGEAPYWHPIYALGETLSGCVNVSVDSSVQCEGLDLELFYVRRDHHQGTPMVVGFGELEPEHHTRAERVRLFSGRWEPGEYSYAFSTRVPSLPSYDGKMSSWSWLAYARANIPWAIDAVGRAQFRVQVPAAVRTRYTPLPAVRSGGESLLKNAPGFVIAPLLCIAVCSALGAAVGLNPVWPALAGTILGLLLALSSLLRARARASVRGPVLEVEVVGGAEGYRAPADVRPAPVLRCRAVVGPGTLVEHVYFELAVRETTTQRVSANRSYDRPVHTVLWKQEQRLPSAPDDVYTCDLRLPEPGTLPFSTGRDALGRGVIWQVNVSVVRESSGAANEHTTCEIDVQPDL